MTLAAFVEQETNYKQREVERRKQGKVNNNKGRKTTAQGLWLSSLRLGVDGAGLHQGAVV